MKIVTTLFMLVLLRCRLTKGKRNQDTSTGKEIKVLQRAQLQGLEFGGKMEKNHYRKLTSAKKMLNDPHLEEFRFIPPAFTEFTKQRNTGQINIPARHIGILKYFSGKQSVRKAFKVKVRMPKWMKNKKKIRGTLLYPKNIPTAGEKCKWDLKSNMINTMVYIPQRCIGSIGQIYEQGEKTVFALVLPRQKMIRSFSTKTLLKRFILINYGKRMGFLLEGLAADRPYSRLILPKRQWQIKHGL